jgi:glycosyltransferase involved in cell wall biosynthesis
MKVLIVYRNKIGRRPYITEQVDAIVKKGVEARYFAINGKGMRAYFSSYSYFIKKIQSFDPDIIHCHYGLSGLFANLQRSVPVVITFHGSDINLRKIRPFSQIAAKLSRYSFYVSEKLAMKAHAKRKHIVQPCGVDFDTFYPINKKKGREKLSLNNNQIHILFSGSFDNKVKNVALAKAAIEKIDKNIHLIELKGYTREDVNLLLNACDVAFITSLMEGSPQFIKEAMACNCPIVSTNVGSIEEIIKGTEGCFITSFDPIDVSEKLELAIKFNERTKGREKIRYLDNHIIADTIISIYKKLV